MRMGFGLIQEQSQKLIMTPELRQAITVLQLSAIELSQFIEEQLLDNPLLELNEEQNDKGESLDEANPADKNDKEIDPDWPDYFHDSSDLGIQRRDKEQREELRYENFLSQSPTLQEHLLFQFNLVASSILEKEIGEFLIGSLDEHGYFKDSLANAAQRFMVREEDVEAVLRLIQNLEPPGVGARNLIECLLMQVQYLGIENKILIDIINNHLIELAEGKMQKIAQHLEVGIPELNKAVNILKTLDPKPGRRFGNPNEVRYVVPDIVIERVEGEYIVLVNDTVIPRLNINSAYREILTKGTDLETRKFIESKLSSASWLIRSIEQRRLTLYKVSRAIIDLQREFLDFGIKGLKPLNLKQVAEIVGLHESTISRATNNKYVQTPQGTMEFKFLFASGVNSFSGTGASSESIKKSIKEFVAGEDPHKPLSDQKISEILQARGIDISRRTVAKYRDELGIASTTKRKQYV